MVAKQRYEAAYGVAAPAIPQGIDDQAEYFFQKNELATVYFRTLVDQHAFAGPPNPGHAAVADLLLVNGIQTGVTTNVDTLIETAGMYLYGQVGTGIDGHAVAALSPGTSPLLKIHGCRLSDPANMVWARGQLVTQPVATRMARSAQWLNVRLLDRDLLVVGFWTDWAYLNDILAATLNGVNPSRVILVDPCQSNVLQEKAPALFQLGNRAANGFHHVRASGADFLAELRQSFSRSFIRQVLHSGVTGFSDRAGAQPEHAWIEPQSADNDTLWQIRRDLEGRTPHEPAKQLRAPIDGFVGQTLLELQARGATSEGTYWILNGKRLRILRAARALHQVQKEFDRETAPAVAPDIIIAVGAEAQMLPASFARPISASTIARGSASRWLTRPEAVEEFGL